MTLEIRKRKVSSGQLQKKKQQIVEAIIYAMRNHPPMKDDMFVVFNKIKETFPELEALRETFVSVPRGKISRQWWELLPIYDIFFTVERKLKKKPFSIWWAMDTFAYLVWLANLCFMDDLLVLAEKPRVGQKGEWLARELRAEHITFNIRLINTRFRTVTNSKKVFVFREDVPDFFRRLPTACKGYDDFLGKVQSLASIFEVDIEPLRTLLSSIDPSWRSIKLIEKWLDDKGALDTHVIDVWKNIVQLRNIPPTHASMSDETVRAIEFFDERIPVNFSKLWSSILDRFLESLHRFQEILGDLAS